MPKIYTKTGDRGDTGLFDGSRVRKYDERVEAYGDVDELNSFLGAAAAALADPELKEILEEIQRDLFVVGAQLADPKFKERANDKFVLQATRSSELERLIDRFETELPPLRQFILAGGSTAGSMLHVARTVCRRAERKVVRLSESVPVGSDVIIYLNRLSDFLFVMARLVNHREGKQETTW